jgi:hypothetical protein
LDCIQGVCRQSRTRPPEDRLLPSPCGPGEWRNWQTRRIQDPVRATGWGFKSPLAHCVSLALRLCRAVLLRRLALPERL